MKFYSKDIEFTPAMKEHVESQFNRMSKLISTVTNTEDDNLSCTLKKDGDDFKVEFMVQGSQMLRAESSGRDFYETVDSVSAILAEQIRRYKESRIYAKRVNTNSLLEDLQMFEIPEVSKEKYYILETMTAEEAIHEMELTSHDFFLYKDVDRNDAVCCVYKRYNGTFGLIETR